MSDPPKSKAQLKAERRALQEAQRAAKASGQKLSKPPSNENSSSQSQSPSKSDTASKRDKENDVIENNKQQSQQASGKTIAKKEAVKQKGKTKQADEASGDGKTVESSVEMSTEGVHPAFLAFETHDTLVGTDELSQQLIRILHTFVSEFVSGTDAGGLFKRQIEEGLDCQVSYLMTSGRSLHPALAKITTQLKMAVSRLDESLSNEAVTFLKFYLAYLVRRSVSRNAKGELIEWLEEYEEIKLELAYKSISMNAIQKLHNATTILTYSWSQIVERIILDAAARRSAGDSDIEVIVVDNMRHKRGLRLVHSLASPAASLPSFSADSGKQQSDPAVVEPTSKDEGAAGKLSNVRINVTYAPLNSIHAFINQCDRVLLGAEAILADGSAVCEMGAAQVALSALHHNIPLLVPAASYKYVEKVGSVGGADWFMWDTEIIPQKMVTAVVTEIRMLPASAAPHILRIVSANSDA